MSQSPVLVLDLDGTCIHTDTFHELLGLALTQRPWMIFQVLWWLVLRGRPYAKQRLSESIHVDPANLPYNEDFLREAYDFACKGYHVVLATGTHRILAEKIANYLGFIREVVATERGVNMTGQNKAYALIERYGAQGFIYAGDSRKDCQVWPYASDVWIVNPKLFVTFRAKSIAKHPSRLRLFPRVFSRVESFMEALHPGTWLHNLLIFLPVFFIGIPLKPGLFGALLMLCCMTSGTAILRDLLRLNNLHRHLDSNPFARGHLSAITGLVLSPILLVAALTFSLMINPVLIMVMVLWGILLIQEHSILTGLSRFLGPIFIGCLI